MLCGYRPLRGRGLVTGFASGLFPLLETKLVSRLPRFLVYLIVLPPRLTGDLRSLSSRIFNDEVRFSQMVRQIDGG